MTKSEKIVMVSGGWDPVHVGHLRLFKAAKELGDRLVVVINNDNWLEKKKGRAFMPEDERKEIIEAFDCVDEVIITNHAKNPEDMSVCEILKSLNPDIFANGGDRRSDKDIPEASVCDELNIKMIFNVGGDKVRSSSELLDSYNKK